MFYHLLSSSKAIQLIRLALFLLFITAASIFAIFKASLPQKNGILRLAGVKNEVRVERDGRSIPHVQARSRADLSQILGYLHAQDRFFQMDLLRRVSAGELSALFGSSTLPIDQRMRPFHLRDVARKIVEQLPAKERSWLDAYTAGVNQGLRALKCSPFEYWLLRSRPENWKTEDTFLVCYNLFSVLQDFRGELTRQRETLYANLPQEVAHFFAENGSAWEARIDESRKKLLPFPGKEHFSYLFLEKNRQAQHRVEKAARAGPSLSDALGSNCWALTSDLIDHHGAMIACDMHLRLGVPNVWYRASLSFCDDTDCKVDLHGATIPGIPALIMGSNGHIGWGFTNAQLNTTDLVRIKLVGDDHYMGPTGPMPLKRREEVIEVRGDRDHVQRQLHSHWGPLVPANAQGDFNAVHWIGLDHRALNLSLTGLEGAKSVGEGVEIATAMKAPVLNFFVADDRGQIGWALSGSVPKRNYSAHRVIDFKQQGWHAMMSPQEMPREIRTKNGRLWNANHSMLSAKKWGYLGTENMLNGIRGHQIKAKLFSKSIHTFDQMHDLQLEESAPFFARWRNLLQEHLIKAIEQNESPSSDQKDREDERVLIKDRQELLNQRKAMLAACRSWDGCCRDRSKGYSMIRRFRDRVKARVLSRFLAPCFAADPSFSPLCFESEESLWKLVSERPAHLADPLIGSWDQEILKTIDEVIEYFSNKYPGKALDQVVWGDEQVVRIEHPLSKAIKWLSKIIDLPASHLGGDLWVPKVLCQTAGASQRMILYPGDEAKSSFQMPGGQSGNPLSKHYRDLHKQWVSGEVDSLLPGKAVDQLIFKPISQKE